ncbi:MAG: hypothetical protein LBJ11_02415 [Oscillospiraceae bacterium]|jgi:hypothetical protein|nr:hypothetical protein [Oscillospiraceae bacterium]
MRNLSSPDFGCPSSGEDQTAAAAPGKKTRRRFQVRRLLDDNRVLLPFSLFLAFWAWVLLLMAFGSDEEQVITKVPVEMHLAGTVAEQLGLQPFWPLQQGKTPEDLTVNVTVKGKRYDISPAALKAEDLSATLVLGDVNSPGEYDLEVRVTPKRAALREKFEITEISVTSIHLYFDHLKEGSFKLEPVTEGEWSVPDGYYAGDTLLYPETITISGPAGEFNKIKRVQAILRPKGQLKQTTSFSGLEIRPLNEFGDNLFLYLRVGAADEEITATIPVWKKASLSAAVDYRSVPTAYLSNPLPVTLTPAVFSAALPEASLRPGGTYTVGAIDFRHLSPSRNTFTFPVADMKEIKIFDNAAEFRAEVDMTDLDTKTFTLYATNIRATAEEDTPNVQATPGNVRRVTVVGPTAALAALTADDLSGEIIIPADVAAGSQQFPVTAYVGRDDCWIYGDYTVSCQVTLL